MNQNNNRERIARRVTLTLSAIALAGCGFMANPAERVAKAEDAMAKGDYRGAVIELKNALDKEPNNAQARLRLGEASLALGDVPSAVKELERALELGADDKVVAGPLIRAYLGSNQAQKVVDLLSAGETATALGKADAAFYRGEGLLALGRGEEAEAAYRESLANGGTLAKAGTGLVRSLIAQNRVEAARAEFEKLPVDAAGEANLMMLQSDFALRTGDLAGAEQRLTAALGTKDAAADAMLRIRLLATIADLQMAQRNNAGARKTIATLAQTSGPSPLYNLLTGRADLGEGKNKDAIGRLQSVVRDLPDNVQAKVLLGAAYLGENSPAQALGQLESAVAMAPALPQARLLLAQAYLQARKPDDALRTLQPLLTAQPPFPQAVVLAGRARMVSGDIGEGIDLLRQNAAANPDDEAMQLELATAYVASGQQDKALEVLSSLKGAGGDDVRRQWLTVLAHASRGDNAAADTALNALIAANSKNTQLLNQAGSFYRNLGRRAEAVKLYEQSLAADAKNTGALLALAQLAATDDDARTAQNYLNKVLAIDPANGTAIDGLARFAFTSQGADAAIAIVRKAREAAPDAIPPRVSLVRWLGAAGRGDEAVTAARELLAVAPGDYRAVSEAAAAFQRAGKLDEALTQYNAAIRLNRSAELFTQRGAIEGRLQRFPAARASFEQALVENPGHAVAIAALARLDLQERKVDAALKRARDAAQRFPNNPQLKYLEGDILTLSGRTQEGAAFFDSLAAKGDPAAVLRGFQARVAGRQTNPEAGVLKALASNPDNSTLRTALASYYQTTGREADARAQYEESLKRNPKDVIALNNLGYMLGTRGDAKGLDYARRAYELAPQAAAITDTYGWLLARAGRTQEALPLLKRASTLAPADRTLMYHYAYVLAKSGDKAMARTVVANALAGGQAFSERADAEKLAAELR